MTWFKFILDNGEAVNCIARTWTQAALAFDAWGIDPRHIIAIEER